MAVIGTYPFKGEWIEVHCDELPRGYGRLALRRVGPDREEAVWLDRLFTRHARALRTAETLVLARGGQLGQHAAAVAGGSVDPALSRRMFCRRELVRWFHLGPDGEPEPPPPQAA